ncbi:MAG TPA: hypothetical protein VFM16_03290, partial [Holophagaceae bacterium]|nr:hypothetical protein [Holophagaceae bacterium]
RRVVRGSEEETATVLGNYFQHGGVWFPHLMESGPARGDERQKIVVDRVEVNPEIADSDFRQPGAPADASQAGK